MTVKLNIYMMNTKYLSIITAIVFITGTGIYVVTHKSLNNEVPNQELAVIPANTTETTAISKVTEVSATPEPKNQKKQIPTTIDGTPVAVSHAQFPPEVDSVGGLLKINTNVFTGKIVKRVGSDFSHDSSIPATRYEVEVIENIKGSLVGKVFIDQIGVGYGVGKYGRQLYVREGDVSAFASSKINPDDIFLKTGATYLFASHCEVNLCGIGAPPYDRTLITTNPGLSKAQIMTEAHANPRVQQFFDLAPK